MIPRWHILWGAVFTAVVWVFSPDINFLYLALLFLATFLIDFDHYMVSAIKSKNFRLKCALDYFSEASKKQIIDHKDGKREKDWFFLFHSIEFHIIVGFLGLLWIGFFYIFLGMIFHSLLDVGWLLKHNMMYRREFFLYNWIKRNI